MERKSICAICGRQIDGHKSRDHVFPRSLYKWSEEYLSYEEYLQMKDLIEQRDNQVSTHEKCNYIKEDSIPDVERLYISPENRLVLENLKQKLTRQISAYEGHKKKLLDMQQNRCLACEKQLYGNGVLRRIDPTKPRRWDNACIVCHTCNRAFERFDNRKKGAGHVG